MKTFDFDYETYITASPIYSRLEKKTQMIRNDGNSKIYHERSMHTSEVRNCAIDIASKLSFLNLDIDIIVSMSLLHDIGHTPFGHAGEEAVNDMFISNDGKHYSETYPGLFKHNINSIKIIGEYLNRFCNSFILMDGILKHTSPFPKGYCLSVFKEENIIKSNFILRYFNSAIDNNMDDFLKLMSIVLDCPNKTKIVIPLFSYCHICTKKEHPSNMCFGKINNETKLSAYICYPFPLTYEGTILFLADEISCFCSDLFDFYTFVKHNEENINAFIPLTKLNNSIAIVKTIYNGNPIIGMLEKYVDLLCGAKKYDKTVISSIIKNIRNILVNSVIENNNVHKSGDIAICFDNHECKPLLSLSSNMMQIIQIIKNSIYQDLHTMEKIKTDNLEGKDIISSLINYYYLNFEDFLIDFKRFNLKSASKLCSLAIARVTEMNYEIIEKWFQKNSLGQMPISKILLEKSLSSGDYSAIVETKLVLVKNLIKREIGYFVASLSEEQCFELKIEHNLKSK